MTRKNRQNGPDGRRGQSSFSNGLMTSGNRNLLNDSSMKTHRLKPINERDMKIIKRGNKEQDVATYILECKRCGCIAEFVNADVQEDKDEKYVVCPQCGRFTSLGSSAIRRKE